MALYEMRPMPGLTSGMQQESPTEEIRDQMQASAILRGLSMISNRDYKISPYVFGATKSAEIMNKQLMRGPVYHPPGGGGK